MATGGKLDNLSEEYIEFPCTVCESKGKLKKAGHFCFECVKFMCDNCLSLHKDFGDKHKVLPLNDATIQNIVTERCVKHPGEVITFFCRKHDALLCNTCERNDHR